MTDYDENEQQRRAQAVADMQQAAVIDAGTKDVGKDAFMDAYGAIAQKLGGDMRAFNDAALAHDNIGKIFTSYAGDEARLDRLSKLPYGRAVVDMSRVEAGASLHTSHEPAWQAAAKNGGHLSREDFNSPASDTLSDKDWFKHADKYGIGNRKR
jgi:hypothetical protein